MIDHTNQAGQAADAETGAVPDERLPGAAGVSDVDVDVEVEVEVEVEVDVEIEDASDPSAEIDAWGALCSLGDEGSTALAALIGRVLRPRALRSGSGSEVGQQVLRRMGGLAGLARSSSAELERCPGVGPAGADRLRAAIELGRRAASRAPIHGVAFGAPEDVDRYLRPLVRDLEVERFHVFCLDARHRLRRAHVVSVGTLTASLVHPREVFRVAVREAAAAILLAHNHPSGDPTPSAEDAAVTRRLTDVGRVLGIRVLDHVIVAAGGYYSFREAGRLEPVMGQEPKRA